MQGFFRITSITKTNTTMITIERITELQKEYGLTNAQNLVNSGQIWGFEGSVGRAVMELLEAGVLMLGEETTRDYYGNKIPPRTVLKEGTKGTLGNSQRFWSLVENGDADALEFIDENRDFMNINIKAIE